jgi:hypothetical protein
MLVQERPLLDVEDYNNTRQRMPLLQGGQQQHADDGGGGGGGAQYTSLLDDRGRAERTRGLDDGSDDD